MVVYGAVRVARERTPGAAVLGMRLGWSSKARTRIIAEAAFIVGKLMKFEKAIAVKAFAGVLEVVPEAKRLPFA